MNSKIIKIVVVIAVIMFIFCGVISYFKHNNKMDIDDIKDYNNVNDKVDDRIYFYFDSIMMLTKNGDFYYFKDGMPDNKIVHISNVKKFFDVINPNNTLYFLDFSGNLKYYNLSSYLDNNYGEYVYDTNIEYNVANIYDFNGNKAILDDKGNFILGYTDESYSRSYKEIASNVDSIFANEQISGYLTKDGELYVKMVDEEEYKNLLNNVDRITFGTTDLKTPVIITKNGDLYGISETKELKQYDSGVKSVCSNVYLKNDNLLYVLYESHNITSGIQVISQQLYYINELDIIDRINDLCDFAYMSGDFWGIIVDDKLETYDINDRTAVVDVNYKNIKKMYEAKRIMVN